MPSALLVLSMSKSLLPILTLTDRQTDRHTDVHTDGQKDEQMDRNSVNRPNDGGVEGNQLGMQLLV